MKQNLPLLMGLAALMMTACKERSKTTSDDEVAISETETFSCYSYINDKDSVWMHIQTVDNKVTGDLTYKLYEKDQNLGVFEGEMSGDTLFAKYRFISEGSESVREVAFLKKGNDFIEGYGDVEEKKGNIVFKSRKKLDFNSNVILHKVECPK